MRRRRLPIAGAARVALLLLSVTVGADVGVAAAAGATDPGAAVEDIRDIRAPRADRSEWLLPAALAGLGALAVLGYWLWRRRRATSRPLSPLEQAEARLEAIRALMRPADSARFAIEISALVREYVEQRFAIAATLLTSEEFLRQIRASSQPALVSQRARLLEFLQQCDLAKFAGVRFTPEAMAALHRDAGVFLRETARREEAHDPLPAT
jgi:hypothetical protein